MPVSSSSPLETVHTVGEQKHGWVGIWGEVEFLLLPQAGHLPLVPVVGALVSAGVKCEASVGLFWDLGMRTYALGVRPAWAQSSYRLPSPRPHTPTCPVGIVCSPSGSHAADGALPLPVPRLSTWKRWQLCASKPSRPAHGPKPSFFSGSG